MERGQGDVSCGQLPRFCACTNVMRAVSELSATLRQPSRVILRKLGAAEKLSDWEGGREEGCVYVCVCPRSSRAFSGRRGKSEKGEREDKRKRSECDVTGGPTGRLCQHCVTSADGGWRGRRRGSGEGWEDALLLFMFSLSLHRAACHVHTHMDVQENARSLTSVAYV